MVMKIAWWIFFLLSPLQLFLSPPSLLPQKRFLSSPSSFLHLPLLRSARLRKKLKKCEEKWGKGEGEEEEEEVGRRMIWQMTPALAPMTVK